MPVYFLSDELCAFMGLPSGSRRSEQEVIDYWERFVEKLEYAAFELREVKTLFGGSFKAGYKKHLLYRY